MKLVTLQTDFKGWMQSFEGHLFSMDIRLQLELQDYEPVGLIKTNSDIDPSRKVNVYLPAPRPKYTAESEQAYSRCSPYLFQSDTTPLRPRLNSSLQSHGWGAVLYHTGCMYFGQFVEGKCRARDYVATVGIVCTMGTLWKAAWRGRECGCCQMEG